MKQFAVAAMAVVLFSFAARADRVGNGGGVWACVEPSGAIRSAMLVDLYEAQKEFQLFIPGGGIGQTPQEIYQARKAWLLQNIPWTTQLTSSFAQVEKSVTMVDAGLVVIDDSLFRIRPLETECPGGRWDYTQFANYTSYGSVLIRKDLWNSQALSQLDKAALLVHEAVYLFLRGKGDTSSVRARAITGLLFSNLPAGEISVRIQSIMSGSMPAPAPVQPTPAQYACLLRDSSAGTHYLGLGTLQLDAEYNAVKACEAERSASYCATEPVCEPLYRQTFSSSCMARSSSTGKAYLGRGRGKVEATYKALEACQAESSPSYCKVSKCSDQ